MSELLERVECAIDYQIQNHGFGPHVARAATLAVLEWYSDWENIEDHMLDAHAFADNGRTNAGARKGMAAAMRAELERLKGGEG